MSKALATQSSVKAVNDCVGSKPDIYSEAVGDSDIQFAVCGEYRGVSPTGGGEFLYRHKCVINPFEDARHEIRARSGRLALNEIDLQQIQA
jgi:hypothetical protein